MTKTLEVGSTVASAAEADLLPSGSRILIHGERYFRRRNGKWVNARTPWGTQTVDTGVVEFTPHPVDSPFSGTTFAEWEYQFVNAVIRGAQSNGVGDTTVDTAFTKIGVSRQAAQASAVTQPLPGEMGVGRPAWLESAPVGTLVEEVHYKRVYRKTSPNENVYERLIPSFRRAEYVGMERWRLVRWGEDGPLHIEPGYVPDLSEQEEAALKMAKARAWQVGMSLKRRHSWCGVLEQILAAGGVSAADGMGETLSRHRQSSLPEGTLLAWVDPEGSGRWSVLERRDTARNEATTVRVAGTDRYNTRASVTVLLSKRKATLIMSVNNFRQFVQEAPLGLVFSAGNDVYVKRTETTVSFMGTTDSQDLWQSFEGQRARHNYAIAGLVERPIPDITITWIPGVSDA